MEGEGLPTVRPIHRRPASPPPPALAAFRGECRDGGDKLRGGGRRRGKDRRLARWSLHRSGSHIFSSPTALLLQPLLLLLLLLLFLLPLFLPARSLPPRFVSMFLIFPSAPPPRSPLTSIPLPLRPAPTANPSIALWRTERGLCSPRTPLRFRDVRD